MMKEIKNINEIKDVEKNILLTFHNFCIKNKLKYSLGYGTLLGAVRHNGFIPWDDDVDIIMPRKDYEYLINNFNDVNYKILTDSNLEKYYYPFAKMIDNRTFLKELNASDLQLGIYIDIFPFDKIPQNKVKQEKLFKKVYFLKKLLVFKYSPLKSKRNFLTRVLLFIIKVFLLPFSANNISKKINKKIALSNSMNDKSQFISCVYMDSRQKIFFDESIFDDLIFVEFESDQFYSIKHYDRYLSSIYGNYMQLPPEKDRVSNHNFVAYRF